MLINCLLIVFGQNCESCNILLGEKSNETVRLLLPWVSTVVTSCNWGGGCSFLLVQGKARTQSPTNKNYAPESPAFGVIEEFSQASSAMERPRPWGSAFVITESPVPGKYALPGPCWGCNRKCRSSVYGFTEMDTDLLFQLKAIAHNIDWSAVRYKARNR